MITCDIPNTQVHSTQVKASLVQAHAVSLSVLGMLCCLAGTAVFAATNLPQRHAPKANVNAAASCTHAHNFKGTSLPTRLLVSRKMQHSPVTNGHLTCANSSIRYMVSGQPSSAKWHLGPICNPYLLSGACSSEMTSKSQRARCCQVVLIVHSKFYKGNLYQLQKPHTAPAVTRYKKARQAHRAGHSSR